MKIRWAKKQDLKEIVSIFMTGSKKRPYLQKWTKKKVTDNFKPSLKKKELWVAVLNGRVIGFVLAGLSSANKRIAYIDELWVTEKYRGKGVGKSLLAFVEGFYKKKGVNIIRFTAYIKSKASGFYKKLNYKASKEVVLLDKRL
ncbi:hypothetical protein CMI37_35260 [Candidatus Pacearchaeota archaeon]|nr:hypothetical protein [Candidatus Pacearchaeota archaeon]|tara:strand:- start:2568 stop:2996 length:429 start_codon:yes stop_codon:yes gene_type:complete